MDQMQRAPAPDVPPTLPANDHASPGLAVVIPDAAFPDMVAGDTAVPGDLLDPGRAVLTQGTIP